MERLLLTNDIAERYHVGMATARKYIRQMEHLENPLGVYESAVIAWETQRTVIPGEAQRVQKNRKGPRPPTGKPKYYIPRVREVIP